MVLDIWTLTTSEEEEALVPRIEHERGLLGYSTFLSG